METKLATIVCSDVIGYSKLMQADEEGTLHKLDICRSVIDPLIDSSKGRLFNTGGDSVLIEFASAVDAVRFGVDMQLKMKALKDGLRWRVGMHVGEVWIYGTNLMGDAVNLAARCESLADYGGVTMTDDVYRLVTSKIKDLRFISRGQQEFKNVAPMEIWSIDIPGAEPNPGLSRPKQTINSISTTKTHSELIAAVLNDQAARNKTVADAQNFRRDNKLGPATRVLMWRVTKQDRAAIDELLSMSDKDLVPPDLQPYVISVFREFCTKVDSDRLIKLADFFEKHDHHSMSLQFVKLAAKVNELAQYRYAMMIFNDPSSSPGEIDSVISDLRDSAMKNKVPAMLKLADYYQQIGDKKNSFMWYYAARSQHNSEAQAKLEVLLKTISKTEFANWKVSADGLVDEIKFIDDNRMR